MNRSSLASRRRLERGQFSWVTFVLLAALAGGAYMAVVWTPIYLVHREVKGVVRGYIGRAIRERGDEILVDEMCQKIRSLDQVEAVNARGEVVKVPAVDLQPSDVTWERNTTSTPPMLHVAFEYVRVVRYPFLERTEEKVLSVDYTEDIAVTKW